MSIFSRAMTTNDAVGENLMPTHSTSSDAILDLFFRIGASRGIDERTIIGWFSKAFVENPLLATRCMFYNRDIRGGQGERRSFRIMFKWLCENHPEIAATNMNLVPEYGRWDDILTAFHTPVEGIAINLIKWALDKGDGLCAKWMPREGKSRGRLANHLRENLGLTPRQYRKLLVRNTNVVETKMCNKQWDKIDYSQIPSIAIKKYRKAWLRHDETRYKEWLGDVKDGKATIHASAIFPHDIVRTIQSGDNTQANLQWKALPDYMPKGYRILPVCDVSGSMIVDDGIPMLVSISLGIYLSERNKGPFQDMFMTFSNKPQLQLLRGSLTDRVRQLETANWAMNTDLEALFKLILDRAVQFGLPPDELPDILLILSDMQFDQCVTNGDDNALQMIDRMYQERGYERPNIVFWNLRASTGVPVKFDQNGTALVSGFSPSIMKNIIGGDFNPLSVMLRTLNSDRYTQVVV